MMEDLNEKLIDLQENLLIDDYGLWLQVTELKKRERGNRGGGGRRGTG
jgi:hypothetical protein